MFNATRTDFYLKLIGSSSKLNRQLVNSTVAFASLKLNIDPSTAFNLFSNEILRKLQSTPQLDTLASKSSSSTRFSSSPMSLNPTEPPSIHEKIESIVARVNLGSMLFGILGNFICILVLMQKTLLNRRFNWYLLILALADMIFCFIVFVNYYIVFTNPSRALYDLSKLTCYFTDYVVSSIDAFCVFLTLVLSIDRLYAIKRPIKSKMFLTYRFPKRIALLGYLTLLIIKSPELFLSQRKYITPSTSALNLSENVNFNSTRNEVIIDFNLDELVDGKHLLEPIGKEYCHSTSMFDSSSEHKENHSQSIHIIYIVYCNVIMPLLFNIFPAIIILVLNLALWFFMRRYSTLMINNPSKSLKGKSLTSFINRTSRRSITTTQKSHYFTIIMLGIWLLITTIPYYSLFTYHWATSLKLINDRNRLHMTIQAISSAFFNSNHCINIIIYMIFNKDFRLNALKILFNLFNLNPVIKLNPLYFKTLKTRPTSSIRVLNTPSIVNQRNVKTNIFYEIDERVNETCMRLVNKQESKPIANARYSWQNISDDARSFSALNLNEMSTKKSLFLPNQKLYIFKYLSRKEFKMDKETQRDVDEENESNKEENFEFDFISEKQDNQTNLKKNTTKLKSFICYKTEMKLNKTEKRSMEDAGF